ncbi:hypothetical protein MSAN_02041800 [Mycena sanguinolenta]|uniref:Uncharacterized protein n=1 Tax=Mycena sanguinolenta TaxID=230812 RepID=A0A8H7CMY2_9AGAR|nr:hypothetical protein MSAN_02041800 [Mycena sanguinolenta]
MPEAIFSGFRFCILPAVADVGWCWDLLTRPVPHVITRLLSSTALHTLDGPRPTTAEGGSGDPILLPHFDLEAALQAENARRMHFEDCGNLHLDDVPFDVEPVPPLPMTPLFLSSAVASVPTEWHGLTGATRKKAKRRARDTALRQETLPMIFAPTRVAWTGLMQQLQHPYLDCWKDTKFLKKHLNYFEWDGRTSHAFVESKGRIVGGLIGAPKDPTWPSVIKRMALAPTFVTDAPPHLDGANSAGGMCEITPLGDFDPDTSAHLVLWDFSYIIRFPPGTSAIIPSAVVTHSNTLLQPGETRFSVIRYTAQRPSATSATSCKRPKIR